MTLWDERLSTTEAHRHLDAAGHQLGQAACDVIDQVAAVLILQSFLDSRPAIEAAREESSPSYNRLLRLAIKATHAPRITSAMPEHIKKKLEEQIRLLEHELTHELPLEIKKAASLGDLSENAEYHMAKQRQVFVNARLGQLKKRMAELALVNLCQYPPGSQ